MLHLVITFCQWINFIVKKNVLADLFNKKFHDFVFNSIFSYLSIQTASKCDIS